MFKRSIYYVCQDINKLNKIITYKNKYDYNKIIKIKREYKFEKICYKTDNKFILASVTHLKKMHFFDEKMHFLKMMLI